MKGKMTLNAIGSQKRKSARMVIWRIGKRVAPGAAAACFCATSGVVSSGSSAGIATRCVCAMLPPDKRRLCAAAGLVSIVSACLCLARTRTSRRFG